MKTWKILAGVAAVLAVAIGVFFAWVSSTASRRWAEFDVLTTGLIAEAKARDPKRTPRGPAVPGNAWDDYAQAFSTATQYPLADIGDYVSRGAKADRAKAEAIVTANEGAIALIRAGARRAEGAFPTDFEKGFATKTMSLLECQKLTNLAVAKARLLSEAGKNPEAVEWLLDTLWFGADQGRNALLISEMISSACMALALEDLKVLATDAAIKGVDWPALGRALETFEAIWPARGDSLLNEGVGTVAGLRTTGGDASQLGEGSALGAWRYGFSVRLVMVDAAERHLDFMRRAAAAKTWADTQRVWKEIEAEAQASPNPFTRILTPGLGSSRKVVTQRLAQLRLLRMAVALRAGQALSLEDPFDGKPLRADPAKLWSVGDDGADDGGQGTWRGNGTSDLVLELKPK